MNFCKIDNFRFQESFRPSLSPTGDVFDDRKIDITSAIVSGFKTEQLTAENTVGNSTEEASGEKEDSDGMDLEPTEATENPLQSNTTTKSAEDDNADENPVESESSSATTVEVKGKNIF